MDKSRNQPSWPMMKWIVGRSWRAPVSMGLAVLLAACADEEWQHLDHSRDGDIAANADDFVIGPETKISYRINYHPHVWRDLPHREENGSLQEFEEGRSEREANLLMQKLERLGLPTELQVTSDQIPNDGKNILLTTNVGPSREDSLYSITFTARQGRLYLEETRSRSTPIAHVDFTEPVDAEVVRRANIATSRSVDSTEMLINFLQTLSQDNMSKGI